MKFNFNLYKMKKIVIVLFLGLYKCGISKREKKADTTTLIAAKIPKSFNASEFTKSKHKNATAVVVLLITNGIVISL